MGWRRSRTQAPGAVWSVRSPRGWNHELEESLSWAKGKLGVEEESWLDEPRPFLLFAPGLGMVPGQGLWSPCSRSGLPSSSRGAPPKGILQGKWVPVVCVERSLGVSVSKCMIIDLPLLITDDVYRAWESVSRVRRAWGQAWTQEAVRIECGLVSAVWAPPSGPCCRSGDLPVWGRCYRNCEH